MKPVGCVENLGLGIGESLDGGLETERRWVMADSMAVKVGERVAFLLELVRELPAGGGQQGCCQPPRCRPATSESMEEASIKGGATSTS